MWLRWVRVAAGAWCVSFAVDARAATFVVNNAADAIDAAPGDGVCATATGSCTLRAAVIESNQLPGADEIHLPAGMFALTLGGAPEDDGLSGDLDVLGDVAIVGAGATATVIQGLPAQPVLSLTALWADVAVESLTLAGGLHGLVLGSSAFDALATVSDCIIEDNVNAGIRSQGSFLPGALGVVRTSIRANGGDAIFWWAGGRTFDVSSSELVGNGAGISVNLSLPGTNRLRETVFERNTWGIALTDTRFAIEDAIVRRNGFGLNTWETALEVDRTTIEQNAWYGVSTGLFGSTAIRDSAIVGNNGLALVIGPGSSPSGPFELTNSTVSGNRGGAIGAMAIRNQFGTVRIVSSTVFGNTGTVIGGIGIEDTLGHTGPIEVRGSILAGNLAGGARSDCGAFAAGEPPFTFSGGNVVGDATDCTHSFVPGDRIGTFAAPIDPLVAGLALNGGATPTHALRAGSPALEAADLADCPVGDQRGATRPFDGDANGVALCDAGAFESEDIDGDGVRDLVDNCIAIANAAQTDADGDLVGDACDNCAAFANPREPAGWRALRPYAVLTGGQRDDDRDGVGNLCDAKFPGSGGAIVAAEDFAQFRTSIGKSRAAQSCGSSGDLPCAIFDLDQQGTLISALDLTRFRLLLGSPPGPKCALCPLPCEAGSARSCLP